MFIGSGTILNPVGFERECVSRFVHPFEEGEVTTTATQIVDQDGNLVQWTPFKTHYGDVATWDDGSYMFGEMFVADRVGPNTSSVKEFQVSSGVTVPTFELHQSVSSQLGEFLTNGFTTTNGFVYRLDIDPGSTRSDPKILGQDGNISVVTSGHNCVQLEWKVRTGDNNYVNVGYFEFFSGLPYIRVYQSTVYSNRLSGAGVVDQLQTMSVVGQNCYPYFEHERFKMWNPGIVTGKHIARS